MNWTIIFALLALAGPIVIAASAKRQPEEKEQPAGVQAGYLALVLGGFGLLAQFMSFSAVMLVFVLVTGMVTGLNRWLLAKRRAADSLEPHYVEYAKSFFPVILAVFVLRSFIAEPFQIPSSSMRPSLVVGDFILVNKFTYGIRVPVLNTVLLPVNKVERGDVVVFNFPLDPNVNFIKRVIGLPGDKVEYRDKRLTINGQAVPVQASGSYDYTEKGNKQVHTDQLTETLGDRSYATLNEDNKPSLFLAAVSPFDHKDQCQYAESGMACTVPTGQYLMMGDNRDNSHDGRYWGFVDDKLLVGKAFFVWMNLSAPSRIGHSIR